MKTFKLPSWWKQNEALLAAKQLGLHTEEKDDGWYIELKYIPATFSIEGTDTLFKGYKCLMLDSWNGWARPWFTKEQLIPVFKDFNEAGKGTLFKWDGDRLMHMDSSAGIPDDWEAVEPEEIEVDGQKIMAYEASLGLIWSEVKWIPAPKPVKKLVTHVMTEEYWELDQEQWDKLNAHMIEEMGPDWETNQESNDEVRKFLWDYRDPTEEYSDTGDDTFRFID